MNSMTTATFDLDWQRAIEDYNGTGGLCMGGENVDVADKGIYK